METNYLWSINPDSQILLTNKFCMLVPKIRGISIWHLFHPLAPTIPIGLLYFGNICGALTLIFEFIFTQEFVAW